MKPLYCVVFTFPSGQQEKGRFHATDRYDAWYQMAASCRRRGYSKQAIDNAVPSVEYQIPPEPGQGGRRV